MILAVSLKSTSDIWVKHGRLQARGAKENWVWIPTWTYWQNYWTYRPVRTWKPNNRRTKKWLSNRNKIYLEERRPRVVAFQLNVRYFMGSTYTCGFDFCSKLIDTTFLWKKLVLDTSDCNLIKVFHKFLKFFATATFNLPRL